MANNFRETVRTFRAVNKSFGFRARIVGPVPDSVSVSLPVNVAATPAEPVRAVLELYDAIGSDFFGDGITARAIAASLKQVKGAKASALDIYINSPGGDVFEATAIFNVLDRFPGPKNVYIDGLAASAASYIAMVGNTITTAPNAMWMVHDPWGFAVGNSADMREAADLLDKAGGTLVGTYVARNRKGVTDAEMRAIMADETWMTAEEALARGFTDSISGEETAAPAEPIYGPAAARRDAVLAKYTKTPEPIRPDTRARLRSMEMRASPQKQPSPSKGPAK